eukprot:5613230-Pyramimonas_sp.AAC.2
MHDICFHLQQESIRTTVLCSDISPVELEPVFNVRDALLPLISDSSVPLLQRRTQSSNDLQGLQRISKTAHGPLEGSPVRKCTC